MKVFDRCFTTAQALAFGIPDTDDNGNVIGWIERPDSGMLRYFLSTLGRNEGFAENVDITSNGETIKLPFISKEDLETFYNKQQQKE